MGRERIKPTAEISTVKLILIIETILLIICLWVIFKPIPMPPVISDGDAGISRQEFEQAISPDFKAVRRENNN